ncbi:PREDICTED: tetratricopeptide repeat protein 7B-like [Priapulus caudatus]|uniref:Tetratricopeptide repeat protein 7B-like n=1 Tax=Priapulus caudatus TaxID=37621 RepID=A0ABM1EKI8_PRICU|nr:PREDICTED: tetratricopeptide repeat protein 7B-like [Priapulus caudatus]
MGLYEDALSYYEKIGLEDLTVEVLHQRFLKLLAEAYAIKAFSLEKIPVKTTSKYKRVERAHGIAACLEKCGDLALLYVQDTERLFGSSGTINSNPAEASDNIDELLGSAIQRAPLFHIKHGELSRGIGQYRRILRSVEARSTQNLRQVLAVQLAEVLLRGVSECSYNEIMEEVTSHERSRGLTITQKDGTEVTLKPQEYKGQGIFQPDTGEEEALLLLLIAEVMANREAVLTRAPDYQKQRVQSLKNCQVIYDLLTMILVRRAQYSMLCETFERAMKFSFEDFHIWFQFALALICSGKYKRALHVLKECMNINPSEPVIPLLAAKICLEQLYKLDDGIRFAHQVISVGENHDLCYKGYLMLGISYSLKSDEAHIQSDRQQFQKKALDSFYRAQALDPDDPLCEFYIALQHAIARQVPLALEHVKKALDLCSEHKHSLQLLAMLLSANKQYRKALQIIELALNNYPDDVNLLFVKVRLQELCLGTDEAVLTCKQMLHKWKTDFEEEMLSCYSYGRGLNKLRDRTTQDVIETASYPKSLLRSIYDVRTVHYGQDGDGESIELYLSSDQPVEAERCVQEASSTFPLSHLVLHMKGRIFEHRREFEEAKQHYEHAIAINPYYVKSLQHLGLVHHYLGNNEMAEKILRDTVKADPTSHESWYNIGRVLRAKGENRAASQCLMTAIDLEATSPVLSFASIPRVVL